MMELHFLNGTTSQEPVGPNKRSLGSSPDCDIHLANAEGVSSVHAHVWSVKDSIIISLKIGANIWVNGEKIRFRATLHHGDKLTIGSVTAEVRELDVEMGFRDKITEQCPPVDSAHHTAPSSAAAYRTAIPEVSTREQTIQTPQLLNPSHASSTETSAINRQQLASNNEEDFAGLHLRGEILPQSPPRPFSTSRKALSLLIVGAGALLFANILLIRS